jgi:hypothetical protein
MRAARIATALDFGVASVISLPPRVGSPSWEDQVGNLFDLPLLAEMLKANPIEGDVLTLSA